MLLAAGIISSLGALLGVLLTAVSLPGIWLMCLIAVVCTIWQPALYSPWTIAVVFLMAVLAEVAEALSAAAGSARSGGTRPGIIGSLIGSVLGLIAGTVLIPIPIVGTIVGGIIGAGVGAFVAERGIAQRGWGDSWHSCRGAAIGRALSTVIKTAFAAVSAAILIVGAFWN